MRLLGWLEMAGWSQFGQLIMSAYIFSSGSSRLTQAFSHSNWVGILAREQKYSRPFLRYTLELVPHDFHHSLLAKTSHKATPDSRARLLLSGEGCKVTYIAQGTDSGRGRIVGIFAVCNTYQVKRKWIQRILSQVNFS